MRRFQATGVILFFLASNSVAQTSIRMPPAITKHPDKIIYFRGDDGTITLECQADGTQDITYKWERNGADLDLTLPNIERVANGTITITRQTSSDEGYYQCFATNQYGTAISIVSYARLTVLRLDKTSDVNDVTIREGDPFHIQIAAGRSFPKPTYGWEVVTETADKNPSPVPLSKRVQIADNGDLYFAYAKAEDDLGGKIYKCSAYNPYLDVKSTGCFTRITVTRVPGGGANSIPIIGFSSEPQIVGIVGGSVTLRCFFNGKPEPTITWSRHGNTLPRDRNSQTKENTELTINNTMASDEGNYTCTARNSAGPASYTLQLSIEKAPTFKAPDDQPHNVNVSEGDTVTFNCRARAKPEADVVWLRNGKKLFTDKDAPTRYVISKDKKYLTINHICLKCPDRDSGTDTVVIQCNASNRHGYAFASGYLNVFEKTRVNVEGKRYVTVDIDNGTVEVELKCSVKYDPTTPVTWTWYRQQLYGNISKIERVEESYYVDISINGGSLKITIDVNNATVAKLLLEAWRKYFGPYICVADNGISQSNGTIIIELHRFMLITTPPATTTVAENCEDQGLYTPVTIFVTNAATMVGSFLVFFLFNRCYHKYSRNKNIGSSDTVGRRPLTTENSTMPQYDTIPYDALPMAEIPSRVTASTQRRDTYNKNIDKNYSTGANRMDVVNSITDPAYDDCIDNAGYEEPMNDRPNPPKARSGEKPEELKVYTGLSDRENSYLNLYADL